MSKDISILEGGVGRQFTADRLRTRLVDGGTCLWVPEDAVKLGTKTVTENGTYLAADDGLYGYSRVVVRGVGTASGKGADGNEYTVTQDGDSLVTAAMPSYIRVVEPPENEYGVYQDGQEIDKTGMVVKGYLADGTEWGTVPLDALTLDADRADFSKTPGSLVKRCGDFGEGPWPQPLRAAIGTVTARDGKIELDYDGYIAVLLNESDTRVDYIMCSDKPGTGRFGWQLGGGYDRWETVSVDNAFTYRGKTVYYNNSGSGLNFSNLSGGGNRYLSGSGLDRAKAAWIILYGEVEQSANGQTVTVSWQRDGDGKTLEAAFEILVAPGYTQ